jgi:spore germination protein KC
MKNTIALLLTTALCLGLTGCSGNFLPVARDITDVQRMRTMALDKGETEGNVSVTVCSGLQSGNQSTQPQPPVILTWEAPTVFAACLTIQTYGDGYISFGHVGDCVFSKEAAEETVTGLLDFMERDFDIRMDMNLYVATEEKASDMLTEVASETRSATERLESIARDLSLESYGWSVTVREFLIDIEDNGCALAPAVQLKEEEDGMSISCDRLCWFKNDRYGGTLEKLQSRAATILCGQGKTGAVEVQLSDGTVMGLRLTQEKCSWKPKWEGDKLTGAEVTVEVQADLAELRGNADVFQLEVQQEMNQRLSETLKQELTDVLTLSQQENADFLHLRRTFNLKYPSKYEQLNAHWEEWFPEMELEVKVVSRVNRSYDMNQGEKAG